MHVHDKLEQPVKNVMHFFAIKGAPSLTQDISIIHPPKPTTRLTSSSKMKLTLALLLVALASALGKYKQYIIHNLISARTGSHGIRH